MKLCNNCGQPIQEDSNKNPAEILGERVEQSISEGGYSCLCQVCKEALDRNSMDKHILNLVAAEICHSEKQIKTFLKSTYTAATVWNKEMTDAEYDRAVADTVNACLKEKLIVKDKDNTLAATETGKVAAGKGVSIETAAFFLKFLKSADPRHVSDFEILMLLATSHDAIPVYIPLKRNERGQGGYLYELKQVIQDSMEETKPVFQAVWKITGMLSQEKERAVKKALMMNRWISKAETKEIENSYEVFSGAIKRVGEDFSWLAETLASLAKEIRWDLRAIARINNLSQRLIYGVTENGLALSNIRLRGLGRTYINRLIAEGFDTPEAVADLPLTELERLLPNHLADRLYRHFHRDYPLQEDMTEREATTGVREAGNAGLAGKAVDQVKIAPEGTPPAAAAASSAAPAAAAPPATAPPAGNISFPRSLADILCDKALLSTLHTRLAGTKDLRKLISNPPILLIDVRQVLIFYRGAQVILPMMSFCLLELLAKNPKVVITRAQFYERLWPESEGNDDSSRPYEQQITDHKRKLLDGIRKGIKGFQDIDPAELRNMIVTRPRMGYMLNLDREDIWVL